MNYLYLLLIIYLIPLIAFIIINFISNKYNNIDNKKELSGFEIARAILDKHKLENMYIVERRGYFTDSFDIKQNVLRFSSPVFHNDSVYSLVLSSYFATKAYLYNKGDKTVKTKLSIDNFINLLTTFIYLLLLIGIILNSFPTYKVVLILLIAVLLYNIVTIPIENKIIQISMKELIDNKYITKNDKNVQTLYNIIKIYGISQMVIALSNLFYNIRDDIKK